MLAMADARACLFMTSGSSLNVASLSGSVPQDEHAQHFKRGHTKANVASADSWWHGNSNVDLQTLKWQRECKSAAALTSSKVACGVGMALGSRGRTGGSASARNLHQRAAGGSQDKWRLVAEAVVKEEQAGQASVQTTSIKEYLEDLKAVGRVRLIVNTGVAVLESVTSLETLFYHAGPRGEYANVMNRDDNVDFHLLLEKVASAKLARGKSMKGDIPTFMVRFMDVSNASAITVLVMWKPGTDGEYDPGQVEGFQALQEKYGDEVNFRSV